VIKAWLGGVGGAVSQCLILQKKNKNERDCETDREGRERRLKRDKKRGGWEGGHGRHTELRFLLKVQDDSARKDDF
jgi:hypothetical protein